MMLLNCLTALFVQYAVVLLFANAKESKLVSAEAERKIKVLSFHPVESVNVDAYNETISWAKLENVTELILPKNFTICSAINRDRTHEVGFRFFTMLGENKSEPFLSALFYDNDIDIEKEVSRLCYRIEGHNEECPKDVPLIYPNEWVHSCMSLSTENSFAHLVWVVKGSLVENKTLKTNENQPHYLDNRMILGKLSKKLFRVIEYFTSAKLHRPLILVPLLKIDPVRKLNFPKNFYVCRNKA